MKEESILFGINLFYTTGIVLAIGFLVLYIKSKKGKKSWITKKQTAFFLLCNIYFLQLDCIWFSIHTNFKIKGGNLQNVKCHHEHRPNRFRWHKTCVSIHVTIWLVQFTKSQLIRLADFCEKISEGLILATALGQILIVPLNVAIRILTAVLLVCIFTFSVFFLSI